MTPTTRKRCDFGFFSQWSFSHVSGFINLGSKINLEMEHYPEIEDRDESKVLSQRLLDEWEKESQKREPKLWKALFRVFGLKYALTGLWFLGEAVFKISGALLLGHFLKWFDDPSLPWSLGLVYAFGMAAIAMGNAFCLHVEYFMTMRIGMQVRVAFISTIYRKCMALPLSSTSSSGFIVNMISNDVQRFEDVSSVMHFLWLGPLELLIITYLIYLQIKWAAFAAIGSLLIFIPLQGYFGRKFGGIRKKSVYYRDERIKTLSDMISGIMLVKLYAWESPFIAKLLEFRNKELQHVKRAGLIRALNDALFFSSSIIVAVFAFVSYAAAGGILTPSKVFVTLVLLHPVRQDMSNYFPKAMAWASESMVSLQRIQSFLSLKNKSPKQLYSCCNSDKSTLFEFKKASFSWPEPDSKRKNGIKLKIKESDEINLSPSIKTVLSEVSFSIERGMVLGVCGPVGAGKSTLLNAILGEIAPISGTVSGTPCSIGYVTQSAWVVAGTIKENILFGKPYDAEWFGKVLAACSLDKDIAKMPDRDETVIGERGVTLSGGQRARLALARAVYQNADLYLLDDPLSAVDPKVGSHLFQECIRGLLKDKAVILVSHQIHHIRNCDKVLLLEKGHVRSFGTFQSVMCTVNSEFAENLKNIEFKMQYKRNSSDHEINDNSLKKEVIVEESVSKTKQNTIINGHGKQEGKNVGSVKRSVYYKFLKAGLSSVFLVLLLVLMVAGEVLLIYSVFWLSKWSQKTEAEQNATLWYNIRVFVAFSVSTFVVSLIRALWFYLTCLRSSRLLFEEMMHNVFRAPMEFFHNNPHGRIMNRFSKDINILDETLPLTFFDFLQCCSMVLGSLIITVISLPNALIVYPFLVIFFLHLRNRYVSTSRQLKRAEGISRSPIYSAINSTLEGISLIRAFKAEDRFLDRFFFLQNENTRIFFTYLTAARWLGLRLDILVTFLVLVSAVLCVVLKSQLNLSGGVVGIVFMYLLENVGLIQWGVRLSTEVENIMVSAERAYEYTELPSEAPEITSIRPPSEWPENGKICVQNLSLTYPGNGKQVLKRLSFNVEPGEKIGIVGRTGAGKSSLLQVLFRLVEPETSDCISIDGVSIGSLGLKDLRSSLSIIPQEPFCFKGTLRFNLDPFSRFQDHEIWDALEAVELKVAISNMPLKLESMVEENGSNWSVGERQLICLARTVLRNSKVVVMDEATSSVDVRTDACLQKTIRDSNGIFSSATVLTIAHRLNTVIDYDKILVLDDGVIVEYGSPKELSQKSINDPSAWFARMISELGIVVQN